MEEDSGGSAGYHVGGHIGPALVPAHQHTRSHTCGARLGTRISPDPRHERTHTRSPSWNRVIKKVPHNSSSREMTTEKSRRGQWWREMELDGEGGREQDGGREGNGLRGEKRETMTRGEGEQ
eukprot:738114-Rhodomonas_salina.1